MTIAEEGKAKGMRETLIEGTCERDLSLFLMKRPMPITLGCVCARVYVRGTWESVPIYTINTSYTTNNLPSFKAEPLIQACN
jgi:hypothetical protein